VQRHIQLINQQTSDSFIHKNRLSPPCCLRMRWFESFFERTRICCSSQLFCSALIKYSSFATHQKTKDINAVCRNKARNPLVLAGKESKRLKDISPEVCIIMKKLKKSFTNIMHRKGKMVIC